MADDADFAGLVTEEATERSVSAICSELTGDGQGYCDDCGDDLTPERRKAAPWAIRCVPCADIHERKGVHRR